MADKDKSSAKENSTTPPGLLGFLNNQFGITKINHNAKT
jgi:hypothetical protein